MSRSHELQVMLGALIAAGSVLLACGDRDVLAADKYRVEASEEPIPKEALSAEIAAELAPEGLRVVRGTNRTVCVIWTCKEWSVQSGFKATPEILYPFAPGQLFGVLEFRRDGGDFRDQKIAEGIYTLRYDLQPVDGDHVGTSPTRDFLLMVRAEDDKSPSAMDVEQLTKMSADAALSSHPAMLCLQKVEVDDQASLPALVRDEENDRWVLLLKGTAKRDAGEQKRDLVVGVVVVGIAGK